MAIFQRMFDERISDVAATKTAAIGRTRPERQRFFGS
jgi:hypothetical protein